MEEEREKRASEREEKGEGERKKKFVGLLNQGATCYLNSLLQVSIFPVFC